MKPPSILDQLFDSISGIFDFLVTRENYRSKLKDIESVRGITNKDKTLIIIELVAALVLMEKELNELRKATKTSRSIKRRTAGPGATSQ